MIKWEYKTVFNDMQVTDESITNFLNAEGAEGWELVNILYLFGTFQAIFKRQLHQFVVGTDFAKEYSDNGFAKIWIGSGTPGTAIWCDNNACGCGSCSCKDEDECQ